MGMRIVGAIVVAACTAGGRVQYLAVAKVLATHVQTHTHASTHTYTRTRTQTHTHKHKHTHTQTHTHTHTHTHKVCDER